MTYDAAYRCTADRSDGAATGQYRTRDATDTGAD